MKVMINSEIAKKSTLIAALCYAAHAIYWIIDLIIFYVSNDNAVITASNIIFLISYLSMAVTLFTKNKKAVLIAAGFNTFYDAYFVVSYFSFWNVCDFLAYAGVTVLIVLSLKGNMTVKRFWFIPAVIVFLGSITGWITNGYFSEFSTMWTSMIFGVVVDVAVFFIGIWLNDCTTPAAAAPVNEYATFDPQSARSAPISSSIAGGADKLKMYNDLLESGAITQDEFDAKKKEILGL